MFFILLFSASVFYLNFFHQQGPLQNCAVLSPAKLLSAPVCNLAVCLASVRGIGVFLEQKRKLTSLATQVMLINK